MWWKLCFKCFYIVVSFIISKAKLILPLTSKTVIQFFFISIFSTVFEVHRAKTLGYSRLLCILNRPSSSSEAILILSPNFFRFTLHNPFRLIILKQSSNHVTSLLKTYIGSHCLLPGYAGLVLETCHLTLPFLFSSSPQEELPTPFLFPSPHFTYPFSPFGILSSMFSVNFIFRVCLKSYTGIYHAFNYITFGVVSFGAQVYNIPRS